MAKRSSGAAHLYLVANGVRAKMRRTIGSKASTNVTYWRKAVRKGAVVKPWSRVREITVDKQGRARGAVYYDRQGKLHEQLATVVVVCGNGIGTPRLLLNSKSSLFPNGLAN